MNFIFNDNVRILCLSCNVKKSENLSDLNKKNRNKRHSSPFINVVKGVFFVVRVTLVPVSYLSAPSAVHSYRVPGKFIRLVRIKQKIIRIAYLYSKCTDCRITYFRHIRTSLIGQLRSMMSLRNRECYYPCSYTNQDDNCFPQLTSSPICIVKSR